MTHKAPRRKKSRGSSQILISANNDCGMLLHSALAHCLAGEELVKTLSGLSRSLVLQLDHKPAGSHARQEGFLRLYIQLRGRQLWGISCCTSDNTKLVKKKKLLVNHWIFTHNNKKNTEWNSLLEGFCCCFFRASYVLWAFVSVFNIVLQKYKSRFTFI